MCFAPQQKLAERSDLKHPAGRHNGHAAHFLHDGGTSQPRRSRQEIPIVNRSLYIRCHGSGLSVSRAVRRPPTSGLPTWTSWVFRFCRSPSPATRQSQFRPTPDTRSVARAPSETAPRGRHGAELHLAHGQEGPTIDPHSASRTLAVRQWKSPASLRQPLPPRQLFQSPQTRSRFVLGRCVESKPAGSHMVVANIGNEGAKR